MALFFSVLLAILPAILAILAYRYIVSDKNGGAVSPTAPLSQDSAKLEAYRASDFPDDWWTSNELFELERRAIFSKVSHPDGESIQSKAI